MKVSEGMENILAQIGEFVFVEMAGVKGVGYEKNENGVMARLMILFDDGKEFVLEIKQKGM